MPDTRHADVCVVGGGPSGASVAHALCGMGYSVCVLEAAAFPRAHVGESLPASILPLLDALEVRRAVEGAGFLRPRGAVVRWAGARDREAVEPPGFQVDRARFDQLLLEAARRAGAEVVHARARAPRLDDDGWTVPFDGPARGVVRAAFFVDAAGRRSSLGRAPRRCAEPTAALYAYFADAPIAGPETRVEAGEDAWYWGAPLADGRLNAAVFVEARRVSGLSRGARESLYRGLIARSALLADSLRGRQLGPVAVADATSYWDEHPATTRSIRVGEASYSIDPLSSQGVQSAIAGALGASVVVNTLLRRPESADLALELYATRQREAVARHAAWAAALYAARAAERPTPFWTDRARGPAATHTAPGAPRGPVPDDGVLELSPEVRITALPVVRGRFVERAEAVTHPALARPVAFVGGAELVPLLRAMRGTPAQIVARWTPRVGARSARAVLQWLWRSSLVTVRRDA